ncbi:MAG: M50 family metallopeptidase [Solirubrobacteraceae bacterium]
MSYLLAALGIVALVILHEAGHFAMAKAVGMRVERFSLFFGPMLVKFRRGETEYGMGPIPLGGYVKITGMNPHEELAPELVPRAYYNQAPWKRVVVILAGPAVNLVIAFALLMGIAMIHGLVEPTAKIAAGSLTTPGSRYLKAGDKIVAVDGKRGLSVGAISNEISGHRCAGTPTRSCQASTPVQLEVRRAGKLRTFSIYPRFSPSEKRTLVGFAFDQHIQQFGPGAAASWSLGEMWFVTHTTVSTVAKLFEPKVRAQLHGIVGGFKVTQQRFALDTAQALFTLALISLSLAIINLFPFLPLDGGHVFWAVAEKIRGRRISFGVMERAGAVGFVLIILLGVIGLSNDISTLTGGGFKVR